MASHRSMPTVPITATTATAALSLARAPARRSTNAGVRNSFTLDLHGQHVDEALASLERCVGWPASSRSACFVSAARGRAAGGRVDGAPASLERRAAVLVARCGRMGGHRAAIASLGHVVLPLAVPARLRGHAASLPCPAPPLAPRSYLVTLGGLGHPGGVLLQVITGVGRHRCGGAARLPTACREGGRGSGWLGGCARAWPPLRPARRRHRCLPRLPSLPPAASATSRACCPRWCATCRMPATRSMPRRATRARSTCGSGADAVAT